jgi:hypothetical protein
MPYPSFAKATLPTLTFSRGTVFPSHTPKRYYQRRSRSDAGTVRVATTSVAERRLLLVFERLPYADYAALGAWLDHTLIDASAQTFTYTNEAGTTYTVRWWPEDGESTFDLPEVAYQLYSGEIPLLVEV